MTEEETWNLCKFTFALTIIMGFAVYYSHQVPEYDEVKNSSPLRTPASVVHISEATAKLGELRQTSTSLDLDCLGSKKTLKMDTQSQQIRFLGKHCASLEDGSTLRVENQSNGFQASIFDQNFSKFSTDFVTLSPGENAIRIFKDIEGKSTLISELWIKRKTQ